MLREGLVHADWSEMTMSMMREKQFEACERRLFAHPGVSLFSPEATELDAQILLTDSYEDVAGLSRTTLITLEQLRTLVAVRLPVEAAFISASEMQLLEKLLIGDGELLLGEWDDIAAAEALVKRLWCSFRAQGDDWQLLLPKALHEPLLNVIGSKETSAARERLFRFDATIHGLLYIAGFLHCAQPMTIMLNEVMRMNDPIAHQVAQRYLKASFEYMEADGDLILLHPGLVDPYRMVGSHPVEGVFTMELSQELVAGAMNGILPEEIMLHQAMCGALNGALRPEYDVSEAAEDLRMLAKQGVGLREMESVMDSMLAVFPTSRMKDALRDLYCYTPHWMGLKTAVMQ